MSHLLLVSANGERPPKWGADAEQLFPYANVPRVDESLGREPELIVANFFAEQHLTTNAS